jgi:uncharacterized protein
MPRRFALTHDRLAVCWALLAALGGGLLISPASASAAQTGWPGGRWQPGPAKYGVTVVSDVPVTMNDGVRLNATIAYPTDPVTGQRAQGRFPVLVQFTPYTDVPNSIGPGQPASFVQHGYIAANVRPRGTGASGGQYDNQGLRDREDGVEIVHWAAHLQGSDGKVGFYGCSAPGVLALNTAAAVEPRSPLKAVVAACAGINSAFMHGVFVNGGVVTKNAKALPTIGGLIGPTVTAYYQRLYDEMLAGDGVAYQRSYWNQRGTIQDAQSIVHNHVATLLWSGWNDVEDEGSTETYAAFQNAVDGRPVGGPMSPTQAVSGRYQLIVNDQTHGVGLDPTIWLEWFDTFVKGEKTEIDGTRTPMHLYEVGTNRWTNASTYPLVSKYTVWYLRGGGHLSARPGGAGQSQTLRWEQPDRRRGTLTYNSGPLTHGGTLSGPIAATLYGASSNTNLEVIASLYDVAPGGKATLVSDAALVGSQRILSPTQTWYDADGVATRPYQAAVADHYLRPHQPYRLDIPLRPRQWAIAPGHHLRLTLTTQTPMAECTVLLPLSTDPCFNTEPQLRTLPGGVYTILTDRSHPSTLNLPLQPYRYYRTARSAVTATSGGYSVPLYWGPEGPQVEVALLGFHRPALPSWLSQDGTSFRRHENLPIRDR